ncbi:MAG: hypothetical protein PHU21_04070 [Elusimicrobia bacterium]|nr:hypothetical protein [Elusimicrobiota bacterium]
MLRILSLIVLLAGPAVLGLAQGPALDDDTLEMVKAFLKLPTEQLPAEHIPKFLAVEPAALPAALRQRYLAKRLELYALRHIAEGKKKGIVRMPEEDCSTIKEAEGMEIKVLRMARYEEISEDEESWLMDTTRCTEHDLMCEFSLLIRTEAKGKKGEKRHRYFLHPVDPLMALVGAYRRSGRNVATNFFGVGGVSCAPRLK